jgi:hypothetical protein
MVVVGAGLMSVVLLNGSQSSKFRLIGMGLVLFGYGWRCVSAGKNRMK